jgi:rhodanese-related sulfurtransferase
MTERSFQRLSAAQARSWLADHPDALLLDARDARHFEAGHIAASVRLDGRNHEALMLRQSKTRPVFIYCYHGNASQSYAQMFADFGFQTVCDLIGGHEAWLRELRSTLQACLEAEGFADAHTPGAHGNTPLMHAAWRGNTAIVEALLELGVDLQATNGDGNNALWLACVAGDPALVTRLAEAGTPIDHANATGATCLMYAASSGKPQIVRTLLALGADASLQTRDDFTALDMAGCLECLNLLRATTQHPLTTF